MSLCTVVRIALDISVCYKALKDQVEKKFLKPEVETALAAIPDALIRGALKTRFLENANKVCTLSHLLFRCKMYILQVLKKYDMYLEQVKENLKMWHSLAILDPRNIANVAEVCEK